MNLKHTTKAQLAKDLQFAREENKVHVEANKRLLKEIADFKPHLEALGDAIDRKTTTIEAQWKQLLEAAQQTSKDISKINKQAESIRAMNTTIRELCRIVAEGGR